jgi:hypothetical protein
MTDRYTTADASGDPLIPCASKVEVVYCDGLETWQQFVSEADSLPLGCFPPRLDDPSTLLKEVPKLPDKLPKARELLGQPVWQIPYIWGNSDNTGEYAGTDDCAVIPDISDDAGSDPWAVLQIPHNVDDRSIGDDDDDRAMLHIPVIVGGNDDRAGKSRGFRSSFRLGYTEPLQCLLTHSPTPPLQTKEHSLLVLCWASIFSLKQLELQRRPVQYSQQTNPSTTQYVINLRHASDELVRWLSAILVPECKGWEVKGPFTPWALQLDAQITLIADPPVTRNEDQTVPSADQAAWLLAELCGLLGLPSVLDWHGPQPLNPCTSSFVAALLIPFYRSSDFKPQLYFPPFLSNANAETTNKDVQLIQQYAHDIQYYMTLALSPSLGSAIWSIFWQPDIPCNLVHPLFASTHDILRPFLESHDTETILKVLALRRRGVAVLWLGIFLLGDTTIFSWITRFLETHEERYGFTSKAIPDISVAAWTGARQSFLNDSPTTSYGKEAVPRSDILWHRYNFRLGIQATITPWKPFGFVKKEDTDLDLWPLLETVSSRTYLYWVWLIKEDKNKWREDVHWI